MFVEENQPSFQLVSWQKDEPRDALQDDIKKLKLFSRYFIFSEFQGEGFLRSDLLHEPKKYSSLTNH